MTTRRLPFGFHIGIGGNASGLSNYAATLNNAGIPFTVMAADNMPYDFQEIARGSATEHFIGYRRTVAHNGQTPPSGNVSVPDYNKNPIVAANEHTTWMLNHLPPELDGSIVWVTDINEPRHSEVDHPGITEWLAEYSIEAARICWTRGYKYIALNYAGGNHPLWADVGPIMLDLYELAAANPHRLTIGTHEYSFTAEDIFNQSPFLVGRITSQLLVHMPEVPVVVTEFGWAERNAPTWSVARQDYLNVAQAYYNYPSIKGAATWYLGGNFSPIENIVQTYIAPLTTLTLETEIETPVITPPEPDCNCPTIVDVKTTSLWIPQYGSMTEEELQQAYQWARYGFRDNNGVYTTGNHMLCPSHVDALRIHTQGLPGSILGIAYPSKIGTGVTEQWLLDNCPCAFENDKQVVFLGEQQPQVPFEFTNAPVITR